MYPTPQVTSQFYLFTDLLIYLFINLFIFPPLAMLSIFLEA